MDRCSSHRRAAGAALASCLAMLALAASALGTSAAATPSATTGQASGVTSSSATLNGTVTPCSRPGQDATVTFLYGTTPRFGSTASAGTVPPNAPADTPVHATVSGLNPSTTYYFAVQATGCSATATGQTQSFNTLAPPTPSPTPAPTPQPTAGAPGPPTVVTLPASDVTDHVATVGGTVDPHGCTNGMAAPQVELHATSSTTGGMLLNPSPPFLPAGTNGPVAVTVQAAGLTPQTEYTFRLTAVEGCGPKQYGAWLTFTTTAQVTAPPAVVTGPATAVTDHAATLTGSIDQLGCQGGVTPQFEMHVTGATTGGSLLDPPAVPQSTGPVTVSYDAAGLSPATSYTYRLTATGACGKSFGDWQTVATATQAVPPPTVVALAPAGLGPTGATLQGTVDVHGCSEPGSVAAQFEWGTTTTPYAFLYSLPFQSTTGTLTETHAVSGLTAGTTYHVRLHAATPCGTADSADLTFSTLAAGGVPLALIIGGGAGVLLVAGAGIAVWRLR
jgi:hypothetical protein